MISVMDDNGAFYLCYAEYKVDELRRDGKPLKSADVVFHLSLQLWTTRNAARKYWPRQAELR